MCVQIVRNKDADKAMVGISGGKMIVNSGKWSCGVCGKGVLANSVQCTVCKKWIHKRCSGVRSDLSTVSGLGDVTDWTCLRADESLRVSKDRNGWREVVRRSVMAPLRPPEVMGYVRGRYEVRCDGTIQEVDLAEELMVGGETYGCVKSFCYL